MAGTRITVTLRIRHRTRTIRPSSRRSPPVHPENSEPCQAGRLRTENHREVSSRRVAETLNRPPHRAERRTRPLENGVGANKGEDRPTSPRSILRGIRPPRFAEQRNDSANNTLLCTNLPRLSPNERSSSPALREASPDSHEAEHAQQISGGRKAARSVTADCWRGA